jgi:amidophosphoribosyltransferase
VNYELSYETPVGVTYSCSKRRNSRPFADAVAPREPRTSGPLLQTYQTDPLDNDKPHEACGVVGLYAPGEDVANVAYFGLFALQHRGQESAGIATADGHNMVLHTGMGLVAQAFREEDLNRLTGHIAIGHTRYSTTGAPKRSNAQPIIAHGENGLAIAMGHNGNVINAGPLRTELEEWGATFTGTSDTEVIAEMYAKAPASTWEERSAYCMRRLKGAYSLTIMTKDQLIGVRDPLGIRPLCIGKFGDGYILASESCAIDHVGGEFIREIEPGETVVIDENGIESFMWSGAREKHAMCIFEHIYFARPDSILNGKLNQSTRAEMGAQLAREHPTDADMVIGVPDSAIPHAIGYANESGIPYGEGLVRNRYVGRTFIQPSQRMREIGVGMKFNALPDVISGKRLVVVEDSIVRGTTKSRVVKLLRDAGAAEIHVRIASPPIISTCHFGVDMASIDELIAAQKTVEEIRELIGADSLGYLSVDGLRSAVEARQGTYCNGCFTGKYPIPVQLEMNKMEFEGIGASND